MENTQKNIGIFGGTFNPIHMGHILCAETAYHELNLDKVLFIPAGNPPFKNNNVLEKKEDRFKMCQLAVADYPNFEVSPIEIDRDGISYTSDTIDQLKKTYTEANFYLIVSSDVPTSFEKWHSFENIIDSTTIVITYRKEYELNNKQRMSIKHICKNKVIFLKNKPLPISSHEIREMLLLGKNVSKWLNPTVLKYINTNKIYQTPQSI